MEMDLKLVATSSIAVVLLLMFLAVVGRFMYRMITGRRPVLKIQVEHRWADNQADKVFMCTPVTSVTSHAHAE